MVDRRLGLCFWPSPTSRFSRLSLSSVTNLFWRSSRLLQACPGLTRMTNPSGWAHLPSKLLPSSLPAYVENRSLYSRCRSQIRIMLLHRQAPGPLLLAQTDITENAGICVLPLPATNTWALWTSTRKFLELSRLNVSCLMYTAVKILVPRIPCVLSLLILLSE